MYKRICFLLLAVLAMTIIMSPAEARSSWRSEAKPVLVIGDSMTVGGTPYLPKSYYVDGLWGRGVTELPKRVDAYLRRYDPPRVAVLALGTNEQAGWTRRDYYEVMKKFPKRTRIVFVTTYRTSGAGKTYSMWMRQLQALRPGTRIADWRSAAIKHPSLVSPDGTHQSEIGKRVWANLIKAQVSR